MAVCFAHLTDIHLKKDYATSTMTSDFGKTGNPTEKFLSAVEKIHAYENLDFILITGDLIHEGDEADYVFLKEILEKSFPDLPVILTLGNHDRVIPFRKVFLESEKPYDCIHEVNGLRIAILDAGHRPAAGEISDGQIEWLKDQLKVPAPLGTILALHQPLITGFPLLDTSVRADFAEILEQHDVIAIFSGHIHFTRFDFYGNVPHFVAGGMGFGAGISPNRIVMNNHASFNICRIENRKPSVVPVLVTPVPAEAQLFVIPEELLKKPQVE